MVLRASEPFCVFFFSFLQQEISLYECVEKSPVKAFNYSIDVDLVKFVCCGKIFLSRAHEGKNQIKQNTHVKRTC